MKKTVLIVLASTLGVVLVTGYFFRSQLTSLVFSPTDSKTRLGLSRSSLSSSDTTAATSNSNLSNTQLDSDKSTQNEPPANPVQTVATNLSIPWEIAFLEDGSYLVTERPGNLVRILPDAQKPIAIEGVRHIGEGGLQGMALDPKFSENNFIYLYLTTENDTGLINRVERYRFNYQTNTLSDKTTILDAIPGARYHDGGRIAFGPDGLLYIATGDATDESLAQDRSSLAGKILRLNPDGSVPEDNPFNSPVYSLGHRNVQGLAWDSEGRLWATEHGPSGLQSGQDEINLIDAGQNYGWPQIRGDQTQAGLRSPIIQSGTEEVWAPAGAEVVGNSLFFVGLRGVSLYEAEIADSGQLSNLTAHFQNEFGRLRFVKRGPGNWLYLGTSNTDGRGTEETDDDKIVRVHLSVFEE